MGEFRSLNGGEYYRISAYDRMAPFLMSIPSDTDLWMFISSNGGLTAGRVDPDGSIFPYETSDKLANADDHTGPITVVRARRGDGGQVFWTPFSESGCGSGNVERNLYKSTIGNRVIFEEVNHDLDLAFRYRWAASDEFGWVRTATLENRGTAIARVELIDGLRNVLPYGARNSLYEHSSNLVDAYKKAEIDPETGLGIFSLTAGIVDRAEAIEILRANTVWCAGLERFAVHLDAAAIEVFERGGTPGADAVLNGQRGNYLVTAALEVPPAANLTWHLAADAGRDHVQVAALRRGLLEGGELSDSIEESLDRASERLLLNVGSADGIQMTAHPETTAHHFANVLFNNMRGGVFADSYGIPVADLADFIRTRNVQTATRRQSFLDGLPGETEVQELLVAAERLGDPDLERLCMEYLPIYFGRCHGDPSRPWNSFSIRVRDREGKQALRYEGNWRDIFQNWEALCRSFPLFLPGVVSKFLNASTVDGFNPYRVTRDGVDWERPDPDDPWSHIGYWGDHQIAYLVKLLEATANHLPGRLEKMLDREVFTYADVPYRLKPYEDIVRDPCETIEFDTALDSRIEERVRALGTDGRLVAGSDGGVYHASLLEKLLVPLLSKLSNVVPGAGVWMNTQRPEWNDANNALVGKGVSVVTLCYLRRYVAFVEAMLSQTSCDTVPVSNEVVGWLQEVRAVLGRERQSLDSLPIDDRRRKSVLDALGRAFSDYRRRAYARGFTEKVELAVSDVLSLCDIARVLLDGWIRDNRREDGLYNAYVIMEFSDGGDEAYIRPLEEMLEGQVAVLSSGVLGPDEAAGVVSSLFASRLYRPDERTFLLYPDKTLPGFLEKNTIADDEALAIPLLKGLLEAGDASIIVRDALGVLRFNADLSRTADVVDALRRLAGVRQWSALVDNHAEAVVRLFEDTFDHRSYTGRSGAMYAYEGLGCVYWHMVAKLLLAVQECAVAAEEQGGPRAIWKELALDYYRVRSGLGFSKTPSEYGAFPTDPYSHTPPQGGARQPGMTGQVKEEILTRLGELGVRVEGGSVSFSPTLLKADEFLTRPDTFHFCNVEGDARSIELASGCLAFTICQVPVVYEAVSDDGWIRVTFRDGSTSECAGLTLDRDVGRAILERTGEVVRVQVGVPEHVLLRV